MSSRLVSLLGSFSKISRWTWFFKGGSYLKEILFLSSFCFEDKDQRFTRLKLGLAIRLLIKGLFYIRAMQSVKLIEKSDLNHHWRDILNNMLWTVHHQKDSSHGLGLIYYGSSQMSVAPYYPGSLLFLLNVFFFYLKNKKYICMCMFG